MGHDEHFLSRLDRVQAEQVDFALALYRDHEAVRFLLEHLGADAPRVALAIAGKDGPHVVVASNGHFVTCLGEGMSTGALPVIARERVDAILAKHRDKQDRESRLVIEKRGENNRVFFRRIFDRAHAMNREEIVALSAFMPLVSHEFYRMALDACGTVLNNVLTFDGIEKLKGPDLERAHALFVETWFVGHAMLLATMGDVAKYERLLVMFKGETTFSTIASALQSSTILLRGTWAAARVGKMLIPSYKSCLLATTGTVWATDSAMALAAIALRHASERDRVTRTLEHVLSGKDLAGSPEVVDHKQACAEGALAAMKDGPEFTLKLGRDWYRKLTKHLPEGDPHRYERDEDVPEDLARTTALSFDGPLTKTAFIEHCFRALPVVARARAEDFYYPREIAQRVHEPYSPELALNRIRRWKTDGPSSAPVRTERTPGRNEPCVCGSGKKFKKCCGA